MTDDDMAFPPLLFEEASPQISKLPHLDEEVIEQAIEIVRTKHERIANALEAIWGYQECSDYLQKLVFDGSDPADLKRVGFNAEVASAILLLSSIHKVNRA